jgi:hypothetical protein
MTIPPGYEVQPFCSVAYLPGEFEWYDQDAALQIIKGLPQLAEGWERGNSPTPYTALFRTRGAWLFVGVQSISDGYAFDAHAQLYYGENPGVSTNHLIHDVRTPERRTEAIAEAATHLTAWLDQQLPAFLGGK